MPVNFEISVFKDLIKKYPVWEELKKYLESDEGGLFRVSNIDTNEFCLIRYEKGSTKMDLPHSKWFRSVVWNTKTNHPVCIAPPKATNYDLPFTTLKELSDANIICQELIEGFMINCFKVANDNDTLHITSRSKLGAAGKFYSDKSFKDLFMEAYLNSLEDFPAYVKALNIDKSQDIMSPDISKKEVAVFYSFIVQHKEHRNVKPINVNRLYLVHKGIVYEDGHVDFENTPDTVKGAMNIEQISPLEQFTERLKGSYANVLKGVEETDETQVQKWIKKQLLDRDWTFQGFVFKDNSGNRWRIRSEKYSAVKMLRGNSPNIIERFAQLYTQNLIVKYLEYYPEDRKLIVDHMKYMDEIIKLLYYYYVDLHITKVKKADTIDKMYHPHLYSIHGIYLNQLRLTDKKVNFDEIKEYLHKQPWQRIVFLLKKLPKV